ncbi:MAG: hypothetical protein QY306_17160 [Anaerolineales bacterium]|nr:MAG: hypothetical protein QY306_17160 [Anaerolineales bacterium]
MIQMQFTGMLLSAKNGEFTSAEGNNKGTKYEWTDLEFHTKETGVFKMRTESPVEIPDTELVKMREWNLLLNVKMQGNNSKFRIAQIMGGKSKG